MTVVAKFQIKYTEYLDHTGKVVTPLPEFACDNDTLLGFYRTMVLTREFDTKAIALQRTGQLGTYASSLGQEAISSAIGHVMRAEDVLVPMYREYAAQLHRGVRISELLLYWGGDERGMAFASGPKQDMPISVPVASHAPHAVGIAYAMQYRRQPRVCVCVLGDGATSKGDFYEAINAAGVWTLPLVFVVSNNRWAISVPREQQSKAQTLAQKAIAAGFEGEQVDGNDIIAVSERFMHALDKARAGGGPTLIEALTYRLSDHTTADDASRYRSEEELERYRSGDPIVRLKNYLQECAALDDEHDRRLKSECAEEVQKEVERYLNTAPQAPRSMFEFLHATLPEAYQDQRATLSEEGKSDV